MLEFIAPNPSFPCEVAATTCPAVSASSSSSPRTKGHFLISINTSKLHFEVFLLHLYINLYIKKYGHYWPRRVELQWQDHLRRESELTAKLQEDRPHPRLNHIRQDPLKLAHTYSGVPDHHEEIDRQPRKTAVLSPCLH